MDPMPDCYIVVVPPNAPETLAYLTESFKNVPDIEIVVNRRRPSGAAARPIVERRAPDDRRRIQEAFGCTLVRIPRAALTPVLPAPRPVGTRFGPLRLRSGLALRES
jgi:hypothetical protein